MELLHQGSLFLVVGTTFASDVETTDQISRGIWYEPFLIWIGSIVVHAGVHHILQDVAACVVLLIAVGIKCFCTIWRAASICVVFVEATIVPGLVLRRVDVWLGYGGGLSRDIGSSSTLGRRSALNKAVRQPTELLSQLESTLLGRLVFVDLL